MTVSNIAPLIFFFIIKIILRHNSFHSTSSWNIVTCATLRKNSWICNKKLKQKKKLSQLCHMTCVGGVQILHVMSGSWSKKIHNKFKTHIKLSLK